MNKRALTIIVVALVLGLAWALPAAAGSVGEAAEEAMKTLDITKGDKNLLVLTNAPYVMVHGAPALPALAEVETAAGCSVGQGNLLFFLRIQNHPLRFMFFNKKTNEAVIVSFKDHKPIFEKVDLSPKAISDPKFRERNTAQLAVGGDIFTLAGIAVAWAKGAPFDFLKCAELHDHICPGLMSGYLIAKYILEKYPLGKGDQYVWVSCPVWCKEDALQIMLDCTPGKKRLVMKRLSEEQQKKISFDKRPAGMLLIWNNEKQTGKGAAFSYDSDYLTSLAEKGVSKLGRVYAAADHLDQPEKCVAVEAEFDLDGEKYTKIMQAGFNPYEVVGLVK